MSEATKTALSTLGRRVVARDAERAHLEALLSELVEENAPDLLSICGLGINGAATLLVTAEDNPNESGVKVPSPHLCGVVPILASSGKLTRFRLSRGGDRQANSLLWRIVITRMRHDPRTRAYVERRLKGGKHMGDIIRTLKRYVVREVFKNLPPN